MPSSQSQEKLNTIRTLLQEYLNVYWLRPETALWRTVDAAMLSSFAFESPSLDLGCGDGVNSYILAGGRFPIEFDDFLAAKEPAAKDFLSGAIDIYDTEPLLSCPIPQPPRQIDVGVDWKKSLLAKAAPLNLYRKLICHDINQALPFAAESFQRVFSNVLYWIENLGCAVEELARVLRGRGVAAVLVPDENLKHYYLHRFVEERGWHWCANLDMGRHAHIKHWMSPGEWEARFRSAGLRVRDHHAYMSSRLIEIHEIGLRPISPVLIKMVQRLKPDDRLTLKKEWLDYMWRLTEPLFESGWILDPSTPQTFHYFLLEKQ